jgi:murein DD-endopeptidase MepM/ murein hydrolase activator NlpD
VIRAAAFPVDGGAAATAEDRASGEAARALEATLIRQLLAASGAFRGSSTAGAQIHADMFVEALADAVTKGGGLGIAALLERELDNATGREPPPPTEMRPSGGFGPRTDPFDGTEKMHTGVDLAAPIGTPVVAVRDGIIRRAGPRGGYGNAVEIDHGGGVSTLYAHASTLAVREGQAVSAGDTIAAVGQSGRATGPHLHFEVRVDGVPRDPTRALNAYGIRAESSMERDRTEFPP